LRESAKAIDAALQLDPAHLKALWLKASLAHEEHRYADALVVWKRLRAALPPESSDVRVIDANIAEATDLAGRRAPAPTASATAAPSGATEVSGTISIDRKLAGRVPAGATLFIYAKAADSPGPPLAVIRQVARDWPVAFRLDDTLAMIPSRKLSQFDRVIVEARMSRSGQATPATGDLYVKSAVLKPRERKKLALVIDHEVG
jgi:cytochrome c-type biogenesis protein CcmH